MTKSEALRLLRETEEDGEWDPADVRAVFRAIYGRAPDADEDALSLAYAAL